MSTEEWQLKTMDKLLIWLICLVQMTMRRKCKIAQEAI